MLCLSFIETNALNFELYRLSLGRSSIRSSTLLGNTEYETFSKLMNYQPEFSNEDFLNWPRYHSIYNQSVFIDIHLNPKKSAKSIYKLWSLGIGYDRSEFYSNYRLINNQLVVNSTFENIGLSYDARFLNLRVGHFWSSNPESIIYGALGGRLNFGLPVSRNGQHAIYSYYYPSGITSHLLDEIVQFDVPFSTNLRFELEAEIGLRIYKSIQTFGGLSVGLNSLIIFENGSRNSWSSSFVFGLRYDLSKIEVSSSAPNKGF